MKTVKLTVILLALLLAAMAMVPMVSAGDQSMSPIEEKASIDQSISNSEKLTVSPLPYANIAVYGPTTAQRNQQISLYTSGQIGNIVNLYYQKLYIQNLATGTSAGVQYISTPSGWSQNLPGGHWSKMGYVIAYASFSSSWGVKFTQPGTYEVVASVVGGGTIPNAQSRMVISVS